MDCSDVRESLSAALDDEPAPISSDLTAAHLRTCQPCREWRRAAQDVVRRIRLTSVSLDHDLTDHVLQRLSPAEPVSTPPLMARALLLLIGLAQLAITVPLLLLGHDSEGTRHAAHELGSFDLALAAAFIVGAWQPRLSQGLAWPCSFAAGALAATALVDIGMGQTPGADEAQHLVAIAGAALLCWAARARRRPQQSSVRALVHAS
jgi:predicted anti-sigma-YlaC factor YlaD